MRLAEGGTWKAQPTLPGVSDFTGSSTWCSQQLMTEMSVSILSLTVRRTAVMHSCWQLDASLAQTSPRRRNLPRLGTPGSV